MTAFVAGLSGIGIGGVVLALGKLYLQLTVLHGTEEQSHRALEALRRQALVEILIVTPTVIARRRMRSRKQGERPEIDDL